MSRHVIGGLREEFSVRILMADVSLKRRFGARPAAARQDHRISMSGIEVYMLFRRKATTQLRLPFLNTSSNSNPKSSQKMDVSSFMAVSPATAFILVFLSSHLFTFSIYTFSLSLYPAYHTIKTPQDLCSATFRRYFEMRRAALMTGCLPKLVAMPSLSARYSFGPLEDHLYCCLTIARPKIS